MNDTFSPFQNYFNDNKEKEWRNEEKYEKICFLWIMLIYLDVYFCYFEC